MAGNLTDADRREADNPKIVKMPGKSAARRRIVRRTPAGNRLNNATGRLIRLISIVVMLLILAYMYLDMKL